MNLFNKTLLAGAMLVGSTTTYASGFYIDLTGTSLGISNPADPDLITGVKTELGFDYVSNTTIDLGANGTLDVGDAIVTTGGIVTTSLATVEATFGDNHFSGLIPTGDSEGYNSDPSTASTNNWALSFSFSLVGELDQISGNTVQEVSYSSGLIEIFLITYDGLGGIAGYDNIFDLTVTGSDNSNPSNFLVTGIVSTSGNENAAYQDLFKSTKGSCLGSNSFVDLANCVPAIEVSFVLDQNLNDVVATLNGDGTATIGGNHNGSLAFNVPEPSTLLLLGSSLFAFGATRRKSV